ncbi:hypothetical protein DAETH_41160 (plasmid) [Deinococcus aetherius]|uniref:Glycosyltransferase 2-like domain-containing protein n=1 Tax=Deinococcus aetherius TaxID=200252 RepID=A0ABM8AJZ6_9DEIO|nr:glycosyltransferase family 2 protein [Deinococcus aetherius]BDP44147.1 hypothetical protein DAETH_41160 [Deinococcus aetherius]
MRYVAVCVCTFRRPSMLVKLLKGLLELNAPASARVTFLVVDNDPSASAKDVCVEYSKHLPLRYVHEPQPGLAQARNRAIQEIDADVEYIAFIDDDEVPESQWLHVLLETQRIFNADAVAGPVIAIIPQEDQAVQAIAPFFSRKRHTTGTVIKAFGAGNVLLRREVFQKVGLFDERYSRTGGEDTDFSTRCYLAGLKMIWADEAVIHEHMNNDRLTLRWLLRRAFRSGSIIARVERDLLPIFPAMPRRLANATSRITISSALLPAATIIDAALGTRYTTHALFSLARGAGMITGLLGARPLGYGVTK